MPAKSTTAKPAAGKFQTVAEYAASLPPASKKIFATFRKTIKEAAPRAEELISYNIPALKLHGMLVYFAAWKEHVSMYPRTAGLEKAFKKEMAKYGVSKGTIKFPTDEPLPLDVISKMVKFRVQENMEKEMAKGKK
jgi:uncharacterized protein YdhG (YjbR/CyaY superfamily)